MAPDPVIVGAPLKGEWSVPNTPGTRVPSHGTDALGARYAFDFLQTDPTRAGTPCYRASFLRYLALGVPVRSCYCYGSPVLAPCDGTVVAAEGGWPERGRAWLPADLLRAGRMSRTDFSRVDAGHAAGNHVVVRVRDGVFAAFCHLRPGSVRVAAGQKVRRGDVLGEIGHTGNSYFPHLHFQLMDDPDPLRASGLPCAFESYDVFEQGAWRTVRNAVPKAHERIRFAG